MNMHVQRTIVELGTFSIVVPLVWAVAASIGFVVLANWPEMFAAPAAAPVQATALAAAPSSAPPPKAEPFDP